VMTSDKDASPLEPYRLPIATTVFLKSSDGKTARDLLASNSGNSVQVHLVNEVSQWNKIFMGIPFLSFMFIFLAMNAVMILASCWSRIRNPGGDLLNSGLRTAVCNFGLLGAIVFTVALPLRYQTIADLILRKVSESLLIISMYLLFWLWGNVLAHEISNHRKSRKRPPVLLKVVVVLGVLLAVWGVVMAAVRSAGLGEKIHVIDFTPQVIGIAQVVIGAMLLYDGVKFVIKAGQIDSSDHNRRALQRLSQLSFVSLFTFFTIAISNIVVPNDTPSTLFLVRVVIWIVMSTVWVAAILLVWSIYLPEVHHSQGKHGIQSEKVQDGTGKWHWKVVKDKEDAAVQRHPSLPGKSSKR